MRVQYITKDISLLARIMRSEAQGEGAYGMKLVGNVVINRVVYRCSPFKKITTISQAIYQKNQFEGVKTPLFTSNATTKERELALSCIKSWRGHPATKALYFQNPGKGKKCKTKWFGKFVDRFKNHCFYNPEKLCNL